ncbi:MAG: hypothetical protein IPL33_12940 [Sphingobacteriales bacterium]|nr:hypothetical protein [Sphingobacteriales bacterium]
MDFSACLQYRYRPRPNVCRCMVLTSDRANVRSKPDLKAPVIAKFSQELVKVDYTASCYLRKRGTQRRKRQRRT